MQIRTKYKVGDVVLVGKKAYHVKNINIRVGLKLFRFCDSEVTIKYSIEDPKANNWSEVAEDVITKKGTNKDWARCGGKFKEKCE